MAHLGQNEVRQNLVSFLDLSGKQRITVRIECEQGKAGQESEADEHEHPRNVEQQHPSSTVFFHSRDTTDLYVFLQQILLNCTRKRK